MSNAQEVDVLEMRKHLFCCHYADEEEFDRWLVQYGAEIIQAIIDKVNLVEIANTWSYGGTDWNRHSAAKNGALEVLNIVYSERDRYRKLAKLMEVPNE